MFHSKSSRCGNSPPGCAQITVCRIALIMLLRRQLWKGSLDLLPRPCLHFPSCTTLRLSVNSHIFVTQPICESQTCLRPCIILPLQEDFKLFGQMSEADFLEKTLSVLISWKWSCWDWSMDPFTRLSQLFFFGCLYCMLRVTSLCRTFFKSGRVPVLEDLVLSKCSVSSDVCFSIFLSVSRQTMDSA